MIKLSKRLAKISEYIDEDMHIIDIGCDHALLDIYLAQTKKKISIIASDINKNALENAKKNIKKNKLENKIKLCLSKGLELINTKDLNTIIISGMGSHTIVGILYNNLSKLKPISTIILQSNNDIDFLRSKITKIGYYIKEEVLVKDNDIIYTIIIFKKGHKFYNKKDLYFGPILRKKKEELFIEKSKKDLEKLESFYKMIPKNRIHHKIITNWKIRNIKKILKEHK